MLKAQKRSKNNIVHLYNPSDERAICADALGNPSRNFEEIMMNISNPEEVVENDYLRRNGKIIGKICGNCQVRLERYIE